MPRNHNAITGAVLFASTALGLAACTSSAGNTAPPSRAESTPSLHDLYSRFQPLAAKIIDLYNDAPSHERITERLLYTSGIKLGVIDSPGAQFMVSEQSQRLQNANTVEGLFFWQSADPTASLSFDRLTDDTWRGRCQDATNDVMVQGSTVTRNHTVMSQDPQKAAAVLDVLVTDGEDMETIAQNTVNQGSAAVTYSNIQCPPLLMLENLGE